MSQQPSLLRPITCWLHYVGGHYGTTERFVAEARRVGVTRRIPAQIARGMHFGDKVVFLRWGGHGRVWAFAEMTIQTVTLMGDLAGKVGAKLAAAGKAEYQASEPQIVQRECGWYVTCGAWVVSADLPDVMAAAIAAAAGEEVFAMIGGPLSEVYDAPVLLSPAPNFTRGFIRSLEDVGYQFHGQAVEAPGAMVALQEYHKAA
jgi:hypothetical protein